MKNALIPMFVTACVGVALAQTPDTARQTPMKPGAVTVSGCVAEAPAGHFMLNNAMVMPDTMKKEGTSTMPATGDKSTASYMLVGGENLKAHVGHKVEVTGSIAMPGKPDEKTATGTKDLKASELRVQSVKMISATCP
jgi:hypothetical protein